MVDIEVGEYAGEANAEQGLFFGQPFIRLCL